MPESECSECGNTEDYEEGFHYCCECDTETYFTED